jgi:probable HAF family extracellular repeat protein
MGLARSSSATAINNSGQVAGQANDHPKHPGRTHAMLWTVDASGNVTTTRDLHEEFMALGFTQSIPEGINESGQIVGWAYDGFQKRERAFLWDDGDVTFLDDDVETDFLSFAYAINNADPVQIVGGAHDQTGSSRRALLWTVLPNGDVLTEELPPPAGFEWSWPADLNDIGEVVGGSRPQASGPDDHATLWTFAPNTTDRIRIVVDLGIGGANGIDNSASLKGLTRVVGYTKIELGKGRKKSKNNHAILWEVEPIIH